MHWMDLRQYICLCRVALFSYDQMFILLLVEGGVAICSVILALQYSGPLNYKLCRGHWVLASCQVSSKSLQLKMQKKHNLTIIAKVNIKHENYLQQQSFLFTNALFSNLKGIIQPLKYCMNVRENVVFFPGPSFWRTTPVFIFLSMPFWWQLLLD